MALGVVGVVGSAVSSGAGARMRNKGGESCRGGVGGGASGELERTSDSCSMGSGIGSAVVSGSG